MPRPPPKPPHRKAPLCRGGPPAPGGAKGNPARKETPIGLEPSYATAHHWYALLLYQLGRLDEGLLEATRATELDPFSVTIQGTLGLGLYLRRDFDLAVARCQRAAALSPDYPAPVVRLSLIEAARGRLSEAFELARRAAQKGNTPVPRPNVARMHALLGQSAEARAILSGLEQEAEPCVACVVDVHLAPWAISTVPSPGSRAGVGPLPAGRTSRGPIPRTTASGRTRDSWSC